MKVSYFSLRLFRAMESGVMELLIYFGFFGNDIP